MAARSVEPDSSSQHDQRRQPRRGRADKRRIDEVFGETMPSVTDDERDPGERSGFDADHYRRNRPPHHTA